MAWVSALITTNPAAALGRTETLHLTVAVRSSPDFYRLVYSSPIAIVPPPRMTTLIATTMFFITIFISSIG